MAEHELRCPSRIMFGKLEDGFLEFKCRSSRCGSQPGTVVIHRFSSTTGELVDTKVYKDPGNRKER